VDLSEFSLGKGLCAAPAHQRKGRQPLAPLFAAPPQGCQSRILAPSAVSGREEGWLRLGQQHLQVGSSPGHGPSAKCRVVWFQAEFPGSGSARWPCPCALPDEGPAQIRQQGGAKDFERNRAPPQQQAMATGRWAAACPSLAADGCI